MPVWAGILGFLAQQVDDAMGLIGESDQFFIQNHSNFARNHRALSQILDFWLVFELLTSSSADFRKSLLN
jgi:hypothetical protein